MLIREIAVFLEENTHEHMKNIYYDSSSPSPKKPTTISLGASMVELENYLELRRLLDTVSTLMLVLRLQSITMDPKIVGAYGHKVINGVLVDLHFTVCSVVCSPIQSSCPQGPRYIFGTGVLDSENNVPVRSLACRIRAIIISVQVEAF